MKKRSREYKILVAVSLIWPFIVLPFVFLSLGGVVVFMITMMFPAIYQGDTINSTHANFTLKDMRSDNGNFTGVYVLGYYYTVNKTDWNTMKIGTAYSCDIINNTFQNCIVVGRKFNTT